MIDPKSSAKSTGGPVAPLPAAPAIPAKPEYKPVSALVVKEQPEIDSEGCGKSIQYPSEAEQLGIEGQVILRIALDEKGGIHDIKVVKGLGHGLDEVAVKAMRYRRECRFKPAIANDGKSVPFVIERYVFNFEIPR
jgi:TonB family protein